MSRQLLQLPSKKFILGNYLQCQIFYEQFGELINQVKCEEKEAMEESDDGPPQPVNPRKQYSENVMRKVFSNYLMGKLPMGYRFNIRWLTWTHYTSITY